MSTILTIDFDIIMWPSIELYNQFIIGNEITLDKMKKDYPILDYMKADLEIYQQITEYLLSLQDVEYYFIKDHSEVVKYINNGDIVINIDHHHDMGYGAPYVPSTDYGCADWASYLLSYNKINKYFWIRNFNSELIQPANNKFNINENLLIKKIDLSKLMKPDKVVICASFDWIPDQYKPLYQL